MKKYLNSKTGIMLLKVYVWLRQRYNACIFLPLVHAVVVLGMLVAHT